jgi:Glycosyl transferase family 2
MLSVVIATSDSEFGLAPTLAALVAGATAGIVREVIVADWGSRDKTAEVADIAGCRIVVLDAAIGARLKAGAAAARAPWLMFIQPGVVLDVTWVAEVTRFIEAAERHDRAAAAAAVFRPAPGTRRSTLPGTLARLRLSLGGRPEPAQGLIISKRLYDDLGGHRAHSDVPEVDLLRRLGRRRIVLLRSVAMKIRDVDWS